MQDNNAIRRCVISVSATIDINSSIFL